MIIFFLIIKTKGISFNYLLNMVNYLENFASIIYEKGMHSLRNIAEKFRLLCHRFLSKYSLNIHFDCRLLETTH